MSARGFARQPWNAFHKGNPTTTPVPDMPSFGAAYDFSNRGGGGDQVVWARGRFVDRIYLQRSISLNLPVSPDHGRPARWTLRVFGESDDVMGFGTAGSSGEGGRRSRCGVRVDRGACNGPRSRLYARHPSQQVRDVAGVGFAQRVRAEVHHLIAN